MQVEVYFYLSIFLLTVVFVVFIRRRPQIHVFEDGVLVKDLLYPSKIPNCTIKSIRLIDNLPKRMIRSNGYSGIRVWKGFFRIRDEYVKHGVLYVENAAQGPYIEIRTVNRLFIINLRNEGLTRILYDEMVSTVKLVGESELTEVKTISLRSFIIVTLFVFIVLILSQILLL